MRKTRRFLKRSCILLALLLLPLCPSAGAEGIRGDADGDGILTAHDAAVILRAANAAATDAFDPSGNGTVNAADAYVLLQLLTGGLESLDALTSEPSDGISGHTFYDRFSYTGTVADGVNYKSDKLSITFSELRFMDANIFVADVYIRDINCFRVTTARDYNQYRDQVYPNLMAEAAGALAAITGDNNREDNSVSMIVQNGKLVFTGRNRAKDLLLLFSDGSMQIYQQADIDVDAIMALDPWQTWCFGPSLLESGFPVDSFVSQISGLNPRGAIGYYEPGHYCLVLADGRSRSSAGLTLADLSTLMYELDCTLAYNLDGGQSAMLLSADGVVNEPYKGGRRLNDILYFVEPDAPAPRTENGA